MNEIILCVTIGKGFPMIHRWAEEDKDRAIEVFHKFAKKFDLTMHDMTGFNFDDINIKEVPANFNLITFWNKEIGIDGFLEHDDYSYDSGAEYICRITQERINYAND